ncbi:MAG: tyrosine recombinase XerC [Bacillota bacterium]|nr:tyrosine recombinase XerC [Bacillota bacterium]
MNEWIEKFLDYVYSRHSKSTQTVDAYRRDLEQLKMYLTSQGITSFEEVDRLTILNFITEFRLETYAKDSTMARKLSTYRSFYKYLNEYYGIGNNPMESIQSPKNKRNVPEFLFVSEIKNYLNSYSLDKDTDIRDKTMFTILYACGLRVSELVQLTWSQIDISSRIVRIRGKGDKERIVPFFKGFEKQLARYRLAYWEKYAQDDHVFVNLKGKGFTSRGVQYLMQKHADEIGLSMKVHPHMFRHSFATHLLDNGADIRIVQELLGHSSLSTTQIYTHISNKKLKEVYQQAHPLANKTDLYEVNPESWTKNY